jgi:hypothetical protein
MQLSGCPACFLDPCPSPLACGEQIRHATRPYSPEEVKEHKDTHALVAELLRAVPAVTAEVLADAA